MKVRNLHFDLSVPRTWHPAGRAVTIFMNNLSIFFPVGERFFIDSVKAFAHLVSDPELKRDVRQFCGQEAIHRREHDRYNRMLAEQGYPVAAMERRVERLAERLSRLMPKRWQLATTAALEHFTATMGHGLLSDARVLAEAHPEMAALWRWHAIEENEHKSVAFDVYRAAGGGERERAFIMILATIIFWFKVVEQQLRMMAADGIVFDADEWRRLLHFHFVEPGFLRQTFSLLPPYFAHDFHPSQLDNERLISRAAEAVGLERTGA